MVLDPALLADHPHVGRAPREDRAQHRSAEDVVRSGRRPRHVDRDPVDADRPEVGWGEPAMRYRIVRGKEDDEWLVDDKHSQQEPSNGCQQRHRRV